MFTGIVEEKGKVAHIERKKNLTTLTVAANKILRKAKVGDSVAVDGVCLTVSGLRNKMLTFDIMQETILKTTLNNLGAGHFVNLERALRVGDPLGGHFVLGHVDCVGTIKNKITKANSVEYKIAVERKFARYLVSKGRVSVNVISLTIGKVNGLGFSVYIIPHTLKTTTLGDKKSSDKVNIETDVLAKYLLRQK